MENELPKHKVKKRFSRIIESSKGKVAEQALKFDKRYLYVTSTGQTSCGRRKGLNSKPEKINKNKLYFTRRLFFSETLNLDKE